MLSLRLYNTVIYIMDEYRKKYRATDKDDTHAELERLKTQLNPHFLFNTLTSIYALIELDSKQAKEALYRLTHLLRYVVYDIPRPTLDSDLRFTENYIALMKLRLEAGMDLRVNIDCGDCGDREIAPMLFSTIVENAFKHSRGTGSREPITIDITTDGGYVTCMTSNPYLPVPDTQEEPHGVGLINLRRRLQLLYGHDAALSADGDGRIYRCQLKIKLNSLNSKK